MFSRVWLKDAAERATKTFLQVYIAMVIAGGSLSIDMTVHRGAALSGVAAALSVVMSMLSSTRGQSDSASLVV